MWKYKFHMWKFEKDQLWKSLPRIWNALVKLWFFHMRTADVRPTWRLGVGCMEAGEVDESVGGEEEVWDDGSDGVEVT